MISDAAARERALPCKRMFPGTWSDRDKTYCPVHDKLTDALAAERERTRQLEEALRRLANPTSTPKTEEAALLQIEVEQIARAALDSAEAADRGSAGERTPRETGTVTPAPGLEPHTEGS